MHNDCCLPLTQSLHYWYPVQHCKVLRATLGMCYIKPNYSKSYLIQRDWWWGRGEGRFKNVVSHLFSTSKNTWSLRAQFRHSLVINSLTNFRGGAWRRALCLPLGEAESGPTEAAAEKVSMQGADRGERAHFWIPHMSVLQWKPESRNMLHIWLKIKVLLNL